MIKRDLQAVKVKYHNCSLLCPSKTTSIPYLPEYKKKIFSKFIILEMGSHFTITHKLNTFCIGSFLKIDDCNQCHLIFR